MKTTISILIFGLLVVNTHAEDRPNIICIMAHNVGRDWLSCYGAEHQTPNIDRFAKQAVRYETAWAMPNGPSTHVTFLTGQYPFRHGWTGDNDGSGAKTRLSPIKSATIVRTLHNAGYANAFGGRWPLNDRREQHGFDEFHLETDRHSTSVFLIEFIKRHRTHPFFVYYPIAFANDPPQDNPDRFAEDVSKIDELAGQLIDAIDESGLRDRTVIIFTSDAGSAVAGTLHDQPSSVMNGRMSNRGAHVPLIVRAPFLTKGGRVSRDLIDVTDFYPTFLKLAKAEPPKGVKLDGRSFVPSLRGSDDPFDKRNWIYAQVEDFRMVRDWHHIVDNRGNFHDLDKDPFQQSEVSPLDKQAPHRRQRLQMILDRFPADLTKDVKLR